MDIVEESVVLLNLCHGSLPVNYTRKKTIENFTYKTIMAATNLSRLIKAPTSICCVSSDLDQKLYLEIVSEMCSTHFVWDDEFMNQTKERLIEASSDLKSQLIKPIPVQTRRTKNEVDQFGDYTQDISKCTNTFEYVKSNMGDTIKNKEWTTDDHSGIIIMTDVTFQLPYVPSGILTLEMLDMGNIIHTNTSTTKSPYPQEMFMQKIGRIVSIKNGKCYITYTKNTNVLTCPYFIEYAASYYYGKENMEKYLSVYYSITFNRTKLVTPIIINANMLYNYFQHIPLIHHIDMSCEAIALRDPHGVLSEQEISDRFAIQPNTKRIRILQGTNDTSGRGKNKNKNKIKTKKNKTKKIKTKKIKTKKNLRRKI